MGDKSRRSSASLLTTLRDSVDPDERLQHYSVRLRAASGWPPRSICADRMMGYPSSGIEKSLGVPRMHPSDPCPCMASFASLDNVDKEIKAWTPKP